MTTSNSSKINVDMKLKERLRMFEEIDKMVKIENSNASHVEIKEDLSHLDNSSLFNYSEKCLSKMDEANEKNFNLPMQSNKFKKYAKQEIPFNPQKLSKPAITLNSESDKCFSKYNTNSNYIDSTNELKSILPTPDNESVYKRDREKLTIGNNCNENNNNDNSNLSCFEENKNVSSNFNLYKKNKLSSNSNAKLPYYSSKSPQKKSENLSDFDNNAYDFPQQISKKDNKKPAIQKNYIDLNCNSKNNKNSYAHPYKNKTNAAGNNNSYLASNKVENPFHKNISNELNFHTERSTKAKSDNNIKKNYDPYPNQGKSSNKVSLSTYENTCVNSNQKANNIRKEVKKDFVECFDYDFYNFPLIKNIPDSKIYGTEQPNKAQEQIKNLSKNTPNNNYNYNGFNNQNQFNYNTPSNKAISGSMNKNLTNTRNRNLDEFLNTNKTKDAANSNKKDPNSSKNFNKSFEIGNSKTSLKSHSRSRSRSRNSRKSYNSKSNTPDNKRLKNLKKYIMNSKETNFGERLYNYNFYLNEKLKNKLEQENQERVKSATPSITRMAKNLQRNGKDFHLRLYPYANNNIKNCENSKLNSSAENAFCGEENRENFNENYDDIDHQEQGNNNNIERMYDDFQINVVYDKNFIEKGLYQGEDFKANKPKRSLSSHDLLGAALNYNKNNFGKKNLENQNMDFKPKLNKKSLDIASKFGPAIERLYPKHGMKNKQVDKLRKSENQQDRSYVNTPKSYFSNLSVISKRSISPLLNKNLNLQIKRNNSCASKKDAVKRQHELYRKGLEKMKLREEVSKEKIQIESETYKQFSYRPKINSNFTSNVISWGTYKTPKNLSSNSTNNNNNTNTKNIQDETLKLELLENNLIGSPTTNLNFNSIQQNMNSEDLNFNDFSGNYNDNPNNKSNISGIEKFKHIYEKNLRWKKKIENQAEKLKTSEQKKITENLTFKPQINKVEMQNDEKFIEKNLEQINDYVNKRRANLKKQKEDEDFKKRKFNLGQNFVMKPTIPQEFNLVTAKKKSAENKNSFNKSNINNVSRISSNSNIHYPNETNKSPLRRISNNNNNNNEFTKSRRNSNLNNNNADFSNVNAANVNSIRNELKIDNFFSNENKLDFDDEEEPQNYLDNNEKLYYYNNVNEQEQFLPNYNNNKGHQGYNSSNNTNNRNFNRINNNSHNLSYNTQTDYNSISNDRRKSFSRDKHNTKIYNNNLEAHPNTNHVENLFSYVKPNSHYINNNGFIANDFREISNTQLINEREKEQIDFVNAINNLHEKLVNLNI